MFEHALVALDVSPVERPMIACLPALKKWGLKRVTLLHVMHLGLLQGSALTHESDYHDWLQQQAQPLRDAGISVDCVLTASGDAASRIFEQAELSACDFVMVGSRGQNMVRKLFLGSVAREVIRQTSIPVLLQWIEPDPNAAEQSCRAICTDTLAHVLWATDFSGQSAAAEQAAIFLGKRSKKITCLHVITKADAQYGVDAETARTMMAELETRFTTDSARLSYHILNGKACQEVARYASEQNATLIVLGKHGQGRIPSRLIGSTVANVCEMAGRPVLVVP